MNLQIGKTLRVLPLLASTCILYACSNSSGSNPAPVPSSPPQPPLMSNFAVTVSNTTNAQPLSPAAVVAHRTGFSVFSVGSPASQGLEVLAEGGDNAAFIAEADANSAVVMTASGAAPIGPAGSETIMVTAVGTDRIGLHISVATMLVNTNDAFSGINAVPVDAMAPGDVLTFNAIAYDAGTEADSEMAIHIPGPAAGGEGFNAARDDEGDRVSMHSGVVSQDDGLATSDLTEQHRFDNPSVRVRIERTL